MNDDRDHRGRDFCLACGLFWLLIAAMFVIWLVGEVMQ